MTEKYPDLSARVQSSFIDMIFLIVMMFVFSAVLDRYEAAPDWVRICMFVSLFFLYEPLCTAIGFTLGNYIKGIRVRREANSSKRINIFAAITRYAIKILLGWISFLTINSNAKRRAIHHLVAGSVMIKYEPVNR
ncbi:MAG: RDD family protein [Sphingobacteriales bacterium]|nr:MAG: RDD family protein [Sphingobacteriales bacterium]